ncbi:hypothetical protein K0504_09785 [Neiella marina]|uniref:Glycerophosphodiester phosphodiesterase n=1 Tax=Neiella holothuriorum TaxID=2870530 RepID=A0ABS7EG67_9GAMM|nr:hypothetical protein [Neiella holothuriorum]
MAASLSTVAAEQHQRPQIAHAGGAIDGRTYTNSIEALDFNAARFKLFELDLIEVDGTLTCRPDFWSRALTWVGKRTRFNACTMATLATWLAQNPHAKIVTDVKTDNLKGLQILASIFPEQLDRFIPQLYQPENYEFVRQLGFKDIIWTLYRYEGSQEQIVRLSETMPLYAITMPVRMARTGLAQKLNVATYAHTVNSAQSWQRLKALGVNQIYTDGVGL